MFVKDKKYSLAEIKVILKANNLKSETFFYYSDNKHSINRIPDMFCNNSYKYKKTIYANH